MDENTESTRGATNPGGKAGNGKKKSAISRIVSPGKDGEYGEETISDVGGSTDESEAPDKNFKILPFQGKNKANMWIESVKNSMPQTLEDAVDKVIDGTIDIEQAVPSKYKSLDEKIHADIMKALLHKAAEPEYEASNLFSKLTSHKKTIKRSGTKAVVFIQEHLNGTSDTHGTSLMQEMLTIRVMHQNPEGVATFCQKYRSIIAKLSNKMQFKWGVETLRARMMLDIGDQSACSWQLAAAPFAQWDGLQPELQTREKKTRRQAFEIGAYGGTRVSDNESSCRY